MERRTTRVDRLETPLTERITVSAIFVSKPPFLSSDMRIWLNGIYTSAVPLLIVYGIQTHSTAPLWAALAGAVLAPTQATSALVSQRATGLVELPKRGRRSKKTAPVVEPREAP